MAPEGRPDAFRRRASAGYPLRHRGGRLRVRPLHREAGERRGRDRPRAGRGALHQREATRLAGHREARGRQRGRQASRLHFRRGRGGPVRKRARPRSKSAYSTPCATCPTAPPPQNASRSPARRPQPETRTRTAARPTPRATPTRKLHTTMRMQAALRMKAPLTQTAGSTGDPGVTNSAEDDPDAEADAANNLGARAISESEVTLHHNEGLLIEGAGFRCRVPPSPRSARKPSIADGYNHLLRQRPERQLAGGVRARGHASPPRPPWACTSRTRRTRSATSRSRSKVAGNAAEDEAAAGRTFAFSIAARDGQGAPLTGTFEAALEGPDGASSPQNRRVRKRHRARGAARPRHAHHKGPARANHLHGKRAEPYSRRVRHGGRGAEGTVAADETRRRHLTNRKEYAPAAIELAGTEVLRGRNEAAGEFAFQLYEADGRHARPRCGRQSHHGR